jgi:hypothetical protein
MTTLRQLFAGMRDGLNSGKAFKASALAAHACLANGSVDTVVPDSQ